MRDLILNSIVTILRRLQMVFDKDPVLENLKNVSRAIGNTYNFV